jgi:D-3-phosphoglycerate dehydrogenase
MALKVAATFFLPEVSLPEEIIAETGAEFVKTLCRNEEEIISIAKDADAIATITTLQPITANVIQSLSRCRHIASFGIGYEGIDIEAATKKDIVVTTTPYYCLEEVSDHTMALILALARKIMKVTKAVKDGHWGTEPFIRKGLLPPMARIKGQTLGLIGFGNIARALVPKARGFGLRIIAHDPYVPAEIMMAHFDVEKVELDALLRQSDYVSLHAALIPENRKMLGREHFQMMKPTAYFINTARGGLVDEEALIEALQKGWIAGAGLDVTDPEPVRVDSPLLAMDNVIVTAHTAQFSDISERELWQIPLEEISMTLRGKFPRFAVNPQIKEKWLKKWGITQNE